MKNFILAVFGTLTLASCQQEGSREVTSEISPAGHPFTFMPIYEDGVTDITIEIAWPTTWAYEADKNPAVPLVASRAILSGGTSELSPQDVLILFEDKNAYGDMLAQPQHIIGSISFPKEHIDEILDVVQEMLARPQFNDRWLEREKSEFASRIATNNSTTNFRIWTAARFAIFGDQPANQSLSLTDPEIIAAVDQSDVRRWHRDVIGKTGVTVVVTGAISADDAGNAVDRLLADLPEGHPVELQSAQGNYAPVEIYLHDPEAPQTMIGFVGKLPIDEEGIHYEDHLAMGFFSRAGQSPLFDALRTELRASYQMFGGNSAYDRNNPFLFIGGGVEANKLVEARDVIKQTYDSYRVNPNMEGFSQFRAGLADQVAENVSYVDMAARGILDARLNLIDPSYVPNAGDKVTNTRAMDVSDRIAKSYPRGDQLIVLAVGPNPSDLPGACVITQPEQAVDCR